MPLIFTACWLRKWLCLCISEVAYRVLSTAMDVCHALSADHYKPDWFYVRLWTEPFASERPQSWFLQNIIFSRMGNKCFPPVINRHHERWIESPLLARLFVFCYVEEYDDRHLGSVGDCWGGVLWWGSTVYEYSLKTQQLRKLSKAPSFIPLRRWSHRCLLWVEDLSDSRRASGAPNCCLLFLGKTPTLCSQLHC